MDTLVDDLSARLAQRLRLERDSRGWSLADLAERSGVSKATISKIERAEVSPTAVVLVRLASAFDLPKPVICAAKCSTGPTIPSRSSRSKCRRSSA
jgi:transcriptional regulator with XRE-family HTH domain